MIGEVGEGGRVEAIAPVDAVGAPDRVHLEGEARVRVGVVGDPESDDCKIAEVYPGTPADKAGIKCCNQIILIDGSYVRRLGAVPRVS